MENSLNKHNKIYLFVLSVVCLVLSACASQPEEKRVSALDQMIDDAFQRNQSEASNVDQSISENEVATALLPDINLSAPGAGSIDVEPRFDIKVHRAKYDSFLWG